MMGCTHGYLESSLHLATRYPRKTNANTIEDIFPRSVWIAIGISLILMTITLLVSIWMYDHLNMGLVREGLEPGQIIIRLCAGFTEPDEEGWFNTYSTGTDFLPI